MPDTYRIAELPIRLRGYFSPDTRSQFEGYVDPGAYYVLEERQDFPTPDTDYVRLEVPTLGAMDTWICSRWRSRRYADLHDEERPSPIERLSFSDEPLAVSEEHLTALLEPFYDFRYDLDEARYPWELPGVRLPLAPPKVNNSTYRFRQQAWLKVKNRTLSGLEVPLLYV